jgi:hypothetical protein
MRPGAAAIALLLLGCSRSEAPAAGTSTARAAAPPDSLALAVPGGAEVWYTLSRPGRAADGSACVDRALEIRHGDRRIPVPLLYTGQPPELVNDSTIRARLSNRCRPAESYLVNLTTGRPTPER